MDSEHRHELKENDLETALASAKEWWGKHQMKVLGGAVLAAALIFGIRFMNASATGTRDAEQYELATAATPQALRKLAMTTGNESVQVQANLRGGDAILPLLRKPIGTEKDQISAEDRNKLIEDAQSMYNAALAESKHPLVKIKAHMGLAVLAQTRGEWDKAKEHYQAAQKAGGPGYEYLTQRAAAFEAAVDRVKVEPVYARAQKPTVGNDLLKSPFLPEGPTKDGKAKDGASTDKPLFPSFNLDPSKGKEEDGKDGKVADDGKDKEPAPVLPLPVVPTPAAPTPDAPTKDAK